MQYAVQKDQKDDKSNYYYGHNYYPRRRLTAFCLNNWQFRPRVSNVNHEVFLCLVHRYAW